MAALATAVGGCTSGGATDRWAPVALTLGVAAPPSETGEATGLRDVIAVLTAESLVQRRRDGSYEPRLAESWVIDPEGRRLSLRLRGGIRFHDGEALSADVIRASLEAARTDPATLSQFPMLRDIERVETQGPLGLILHLRQRSTLLLDDLTLPITRGPDSRPAGTGPFMLAGERDGMPVLRANDDYHRGRPQIDTIVIKSYPTVRSAWAAMMRSEIDILFQVPNDTREFVEAESSVQVFAFDRPYVYFLGFNTGRPPFRDPAVRQALNHAVDRGAIIEHTLHGHGRAGSGTWPFHWAYQGASLVYHYDPQRADRLLTEGGYPPHAISGRDGPDGLPSRLRFVCLVPSDLAPFEMLALQLQKQFYDIGVDMRVEAMPSKEFLRRIDARDYDAVLLWRNTGEALSRLYSSWHSSEPGGLGYRGVDAALDALRAAPTETAIREAAAELQRRFYEDPPAIFVADREDARAVSRRFEVPTAPGQDVIETIWQWRPAREPKTE